MEINKDNNNPAPENGESKAPEKRAVRNAARPVPARPSNPAQQTRGTSGGAGPNGGSPNRTVPQGRAVPSSARREGAQNAPKAESRPAGRTIPGSTDRTAGRPVRPPVRRAPTGEGQRPVPRPADPAKAQSSALRADGEEMNMNTRVVNMPPEARTSRPAPAKADPQSSDQADAVQAASENTAPEKAPAEAPIDKARSSVLRPTVPVEETAAGTRVIPTVNRVEKKAEPIVPKKKQKNTSMRERLREEGNNAVLSLVKAAIYLVCVLLISTIISVTVIMVGNDIFAFVKSEDPVTVVIPENADIDTIADILAENGIIKYPSIFKMYCEDEDKAYDKNAGVFVAGTYELTPSTDYEDLFLTFKPKAPSGTSWITFPEGLTTDEIIDLLIEKGVGNIDLDEKDQHYEFYSRFDNLRDAYAAVINEYDFSSYWFVEELEGKTHSDRIYRLDGYLFPDTYEFYNASKPHTVINKMLARFSQIFTEEYRTLATESGFTVDEIVTLASMVEKEAADAADYFNVSEVFRNRMANTANFPYLESDATVLYYIHHTTGTRPEKTTPEDTEKDVTYNTYKYKGLPPGPISNPSATAMLAALNPSKNGYYFFVTGNYDTYFTPTKDQHDYYIRLIQNGQA